MDRRTLGGAATLALAVGLVAPVVASAQERQDSVALPMDALVVTATRSARTVGDVASSVTVVDTLDLRSTTATSVGDLLREIPGLSSLRLFSTLVSPPSTQGVVTRGIGGSSSSRTLVLLDGQPIVDPFSGWMHWERIPMDYVERIEVVRGGTAGTWGNRALGGVINVITKNPTETNGLLSAQGGGLGTWKAAISGAYVGSDFSIVGFTEQADTEGYITMAPDFRGLIDQEQWTSHQTYYGKAIWSPSEPVTVRLDGSWYEWDSGNGTALGASNARAALLRGQVGLSTDRGDLWTFGAHLSDETYGNLVASSASDRSSERPANRQYDVPATAWGFTTHWSGAVTGRHELSAGADVEWTRGETREEFLYRSGAFTRDRLAGGEQLLAGAYVQDAFAISRSFELFASGRVNFWQTMSGFRIESEKATGEALIDESPPSRSTVGVDFNLGFRHDLGSRVSWRGAVFSGFRAPTLSELYRPFRSSGNVVGAANSALDPERLLGMEMGADFTVPGSFQARATVFFNRVRDAIGDATIEVTGDEARTIEPCGRVPAEGVCRQRANFGTIQSIGLETELEYAVGRRWRFSGSHIYNPTQLLDTESRPELEGLRVRRVPIHQLQTRISRLDPGTVDLSFSARYTGTRYDDDRNTAMIEDSFLLGLRASRRVSENAELFLTIENLLDDDIQVARSTSGQIRLGLPRMIQGGFKLSF